MDLNLLFLGVSRLILAMKEFSRDDRLLFAYIAANHCDLSCLKIEIISLSFSLRLVQVSLSPFLTTLL